MLVLLYNNHGHVVLMLRAAGYDYDMVRDQGGGVDKPG
jgi:hypothetical protein